MPPIPIYVLTIALAFLPLLYILSLILPPLGTFPVRKELSLRQALTMSALLAPAIGFTFLTDQYLQAGILVLCAAGILAVGVGAHRATPPGAADDGAPHPYKK